MGDLFFKRMADKLEKYNTEPKYDSNWLKMSVGAEYSLAKRRGLDNEAESIGVLKRIIKKMK